MELLYVDGCESYPHALALLERLLADRGVSTDVELRRVESDDEARRERFLGSPTIRVDGVDVEPDAEARIGFGLSCRIYPGSDGVERIPPADWIAARLELGGSDSVLVCRHQTFVSAPLAGVWALVGDPRRHPEWWPELVEVQGCSDFGQGCAYCHVTEGDGERVETKLRVERLEELKELLVRCDENGLYMRWLLTEARAGTFVDAEFGIDPDRAREREANFDPASGKHMLRRWLQTSLDGLAEVAALTRS